MTRAECATAEFSQLWDQQRLELVHGELISKMGKKRPHVNALVAVQAWLVRIFGEQFVNPEAPIDVAPEDNPTNEPEPGRVSDQSIRPQTFNEGVQAPRLAAGLSPGRRH